MKGAMPSGDRIPVMWMAARACLLVLSSAPGKQSRTVVQSFYNNAITQNKIAVYMFHTSQTTTATYSDFTVLHSCIL